MGKNLSVTGEKMGEDKLKGNIIIVCFKIAMCCCMEFMTSKFKV